MEKINQFHQGLFGLVLPGNIGEAFARLRFHVDLGVTFTEAHGIAAHPVPHETHEELPQDEKDNDWENPVGKEVGKRRTLFRNDLGEFYFALHQTVDQIRVFNTAGYINSFICIVFGDYCNFVRSYFNLGYLSFIDLLQEITIRNFLNLGAEVHRRYHRVKEIDHQNCYQIIID
ncbi:hypothetical protein SDC9_71959 [bioreactor metagenome]|uniref:Uncharacterized protein n=1 Tax=bioreactor metagenome TaxID=1076179 RepID=A0A644YA96_9ZZZZ